VSGWPIGAAAGGVAKLLRKLRKRHRLLRPFATPANFGLTQECLESAHKMGRLEILDKGGTWWTVRLLPDVAIDVRITGPVRRCKATMMHARWKDPRTGKDRQLTRRDVSRKDMREAVRDTQTGKLIFSFSFVEGTRV